MRKSSLFALALVAAAVLLAAPSLLAQTIVYPLAQQDPAASGFTSGGVADCTRGWLFQVNAANKAVYRLGCLYPDSTSSAKSIALWHVTSAAPAVTTGTLLAQVTTTPGTGWRWVDLQTAVPLTQGQRYIVLGHTSTVSYYYHNSPAASWRPTGDIQYMDVRYSNSVTLAAFPTSFPTSTLSPHQYGVVDIGYGDAQVQGPSVEVKSVSVTNPGNRPIVGNNTIQFELRNGGTTPYANIPVSVQYSTDNGLTWPVTESFTSPNLNYPNTVTFQFTQPWVVTAPGTFNVQVRLSPNIGTQNQTATQSWQVYGTPNIVPQFTDTFNFPTSLDQYAVIKGSLADAQIKSAAAQGTGTGVRLMSTQSTGTFTPVDLSNAAHRAVIDDPALWDGGGAVNPSSFVGSMVLTTLASGVQNLNVSFAYRIVQSGTTPAGFADRQANMIFQWSLDNSTWNMAAGPTANTAGIYRATVTGTTPPAHTVENISITGLPGTANQLLFFRFRWLCRLKDDTTSVQTYVDIDNLQFTVPFTINTLSLPSATGNIPYEYENGPVNITQISGSAPVSFSVIPPPAWMTLNASSGLITGMPPASAAGTTNLTFSATDSSSAVATRVIPFTVKPAPSAVAISNLVTLPDASEGIGYDYNLSAFGGAPIQFGTTNPRYFWSITTDASSSWLSVEPNTGRLTGTPPLGSFGSTARFTAYVKDGLADMPAGTAANRTNKEFFINIVEQLTVPNTSLDLAREGNGYRPVFTATGGTQPYTWEIAAGSLPAGLTFQPETGLIIGVPLLGQTGTYPLVIEVRDAGIQSVQFNTTLVVAAATTSSNLHITTTELNPGAATETQPFETFLDAVEGVPPYFWDVATTSPDGLPSGLTIDNFGRISGSPFSGTARPYAITFRVTDSAPTPQVHTVTLDLDVLGLVSAPSIVTSLLQTAEVGQAYPPPVPFPPVNINAPGLRVSGGSAPFAWQLVSGALPEGLTFSSIGLISGVPVKDAELQSPYTITVRVTDAQQLIHERTLIIDVLPFSGAPLNVIATTPPASTEGSPYSFRLTASGGANPTGSTLPYVFRRVTGTLPTGMDMDPFGQIRGTPIAGTAGTYDLVVEAKDTAGFTAQANISLSVIASGGGGGGGGPVADPVSFAGSGSGCSMATSEGHTGIALLLGLLALMAAPALRRKRA